MLGVAGEPVAGARNAAAPTPGLTAGNEDCGKPFYLQNYLAFFGAISARYPHMRLISNCDMGQDAPTGEPGAALSCAAWR